MFNRKSKRLFLPLTILANAGKRIFPALLFLLVCCTSFAQMPAGAKGKMTKAQEAAYKASIRRINILRSDQLKSFVTPDSVTRMAFVGHVQLKQDKTYFECDSVVLNNESQFAEAFGHVYMNDAGQSKIHSDYLRYDGKTRKAFLSGNVRLDDKTSKLKTPTLDYDLNTKTAIYTQGGHLVSDKTVLTSKGGVYSSESKDATFTGDVKLRNPQYNINSDTLLYNAKYDSVTFVSPTTIYDGPYHKVITSDGYYNLKTKQAYFGLRPTIIDSTSTLIADEVATDRAAGYSEARGNVVFKDTAQGIVLVSDNLKTNETNKSLLATENPVTIIKQDSGDSLYVGGDTIYSGRLSDRLASGDSAKLSVSGIFLGDRVTTDSTVKRPTIGYKTQREVIKNILLPNGKDSLVSELPVAITKPLPSLQLKKPDLSFPIDSSQLNGPPDSLHLLGNNNSLSIDSSSINDSTAFMTTAEKKQFDKSMSDAAFQKAEKDSLVLPEVHLTSKKSTHKTKNKAIKPVEKQNNNDRYIEVYRGVRIYSDSMQAASDSLFYSFKDSLFRLYQNPVVWNKDNQMTGDTIYLYSENKKPKRVFVWENGVIVNKVDSVASRPYYNQVKGRTIDARFTNGALDSLVAKGNAENVYYLLDENNRYIGGNKGTSNEIRSYFKNRQPEKIVMIKNIEGTITPMRSLNMGEMHVRGYRIETRRRPRSKFDILDRSATLENKTSDQQQDQENPSVEGK